MAYIVAREGESFEQTFRRFKKTCEKAAILAEVKKREYHEKNGIRLKKKSIAARKRLLKKSRY